MGGSQNWIFSLCLMSLRSVLGPRANPITPPALWFESQVLPLWGLNPHAWKARLVRSTQPKVQRKGSMHSVHTPSRKADKISALGHSETKASCNRVTGNYVDLSRAEERYRKLNTEIYTYFAEKIKELGLRWMLLVGFRAELCQHFEVTSAKLKENKKPATQERCMRDTRDLNWLAQYLVGEDLNSKVLRLRSLFLTCSKQI